MRYVLLLIVSAAGLAWLIADSACRRRPILVDPADAAVEAADTHNVPEGLECPCAPELGEDD